MKIGIRGSKNNENRVGLSPSGVHTLHLESGHTVFSGNKCGFRIVL